MVIAEIATSPQFIICRQQSPGAPAQPTPRIPFQVLEVRRHIPAVRPNGCAALRALEDASGRVKTQIA